MSSGEQAERVRVLLVEDDASFAEMYKLKLEKDEYQVEIAPNGEAALRMAASAPPDLIFLDIQLPKRGGLEVLEQFRRMDATRYTPVVILSNLEEPELKNRGLALGALEYVLKSQTTPGQMSGRIKKWARRRRN